MAAIHAIILTLNEALHLERCIRSLGGVCSSITVVDSGSSDDTVDIARRLGATVLANPWTNYATQMNFAIDAVADRGGWLLRIDADEVLDSESGETLNEAVSRAGPDIDGLIVQRRIHFLGRRIRHGAIEPSWQLRLFRNGRGRCEQRWMDEHILVEGRVAKSRLILSDINLNSLTWWTSKHNTYASREAIDALNARHKFMQSNSVSEGSANAQAKVRRFLKERVYRNLPAGPRALFYFIYRYLLRLGFLDGAEGLYFHFLQGFWYRLVVDAKIAEIERHARTFGIPIEEAILDRTGIRPRVNAIARE